jgi:hypothetical protein
MARRGMTSNALKTAALVGAIGLGGLLLYRQARPGADPLDSLQAAIDGLLDNLPGSSQISATPSSAQPSGGVITPVPNTGPARVDQVDPSRLVALTAGAQPTISEILALGTGQANDPTDDQGIVTPDGRVFFNRGLVNGTLSGLKDDEFAAVPDFVKQGLR